MSVPADRSAHPRGARSGRRRTSAIPVLIFTALLCALLHSGCRDEPEDTAKSASTPENDEAPASEASQPETGAESAVDDEQGGGQQADVDPADDTLPATWVEWTSADGGFRTRFPEPPTQSVRRVDLDKERTLTIHEATAAGSDGVIYSTAWLKIPAPGSKKRARALLERHSEQLAERLGGHIEATAPTEFSGQPARDLRIVGTHPDENRPVRARTFVRLILVGDRLYQVMVVEPANVTSRSGAFIDAFEVFVEPRAQRSAATWTAYALPGTSGLEVEFPGAPRRDETTLASPGEPLKATRWLYNAPRGGLALSVSVVELPESVHLEHAPNAILDAARDGVVERVDGELVDSTAVRWSEHPGRSVEVTLAGPSEEHEARLWARIYLVQTTMPILVQLEVSGVGVDGLPAAGERFFKSLSSGSESED